jgi:hypothetical protein
MLKRLLSAWGLFVGGLLIVGGKSNDFATTKQLTNVIFTYFLAGLNSLTLSFPSFIRKFSHGQKSLILSVNFPVIPIIHNTYNNEQQYKLTYY